MFEAELLEDEDEEEGPRTLNIRGCASRFTRLQQPPITFDFLSVVLLVLALPVVVVAVVVVFVVVVEVVFANFSISINDDAIIFLQY